MKEVQVCSNEGPCHFPRGDNYKIAKIHKRNLHYFYRTTEPISTNLGTKHPWMKGIEILFKWQPINCHKVNNGFFPSLNQHYDIILCVYWFKLLSQVNNVAHGPLVLFFFKLESTWTNLCLILDGFVLHSIKNNDAFIKGELRHFNFEIIHKAIKLRFLWMICLSV